MKKKSTLYILLVFLILSNAFFLFHFMGKRGPRKGKPEDFIVKKLNFSETQMNDYSFMKDLHFDNMESISKSIRDLKGEMFSKISEKNVSESFLDSITDLIAIKEKQKDLEVFNHLQKVRKICNEEQKKRFSKIVNDAMKRRGRRGRGKGHKE